MDNLELLYDHYKDTYEKLERQISQRNRKFILSFVISCVLLLFALNPAEYLNLLFGYINAKYSIDLSGQFYVLQTFLWVVLLYETLRYSQVFANIENTYDYLSSLERNISELADLNFNRESGHYSSHFSLPLKYANFAYKFIFPTFLAFVAVLKIFSETQISTPSVLLIIDSIIFLAHVLLILFHVIFAVKTN